MDNSLKELAFSFLALLSGPGYDGDAVEAARTIKALPEWYESDEPNGSPDVEIILRSRETAERILAEK